MADQHCRAKESTEPRNWSTATSLEEFLKEHGYEVKDVCDYGLCEADDEEVFNLHLRRRSGTSNG